MKLQERVDTYIDLRKQIEVLEVARRLMEKELVQEIGDNKVENKFGKVSMSTSISYKFSEKVTKYKYSDDLERMRKASEVATDVYKEAKKLEDIVVDGIKDGEIKNGTAAKSEKFSIRFTGKK